MRNSRRRDVVCLGLVGAVLATWALAHAARAESIWARRKNSAAFLYHDNVAAEVGDSITVLISDSASFKHKDSRDMAKETDLGASASLKRTSSRTGQEELTLFDPFNVEAESSRTFKGSSDYSGSRTFSDVLSVTVIDRLPNGNLVVAGRSEREIAGETAATVLTGTVRPMDIAGDNTVSSQRVAHLKVYYETSGASQSFARQGIVGLLINLLWPF